MEGLLLSRRQASFARVHRIVRGAWQSYRRFPAEDIEAPAARSLVLSQTLTSAWRFLIGCLALPRAPLSLSFLKQNEVIILAAPVSQNQVKNMKDF